MPISEFILITLGSCAEIIVFSIYINLVCTPRFNRFVFPIALFAASFCMLLLFRNSYTELGYIRGAVNLIAIVLSVLILYKDKTSYKLLCTFAVYMCSALISGAVIVAFKILELDAGVFYSAENQGTFGTWALRAFMTVSQSLGAYLFINILKKQVTENMKIAYYFIGATSIFYLMHLYIAYITSMYNIDMMNTIIALSISSFSMFGFNLLAFVSLRKMQEANILETQRKEQYTSLAQQYEALQKNYHDFRKLRHDFKDHILVISALTNSGDSDKLSSYLATVQNDLKKLENTMFCSNSAINVILASKYQSAQNANIHMNITVGNLDKLNIDEIYLCSIVSNLLQNAIENTTGDIDFNMFIRAQQLVMVCKNDINKDTVTFDTSKKDRENHGYGHRIIYDICEQLDGNCIFDTIDKRFVATINIPLGER